MRPTPRLLPALAVTAGIVVGSLAGAAPAGARTPLDGWRVTTKIGSTPVPTADRLASNRTDTASVSNDGRYVAFATEANGPGDTNGATDVYVRDRQLGTSQLISRTGSGTGTARGGAVPSLSPDGRYVVFATWYPYVAGDTEGGRDVYVYDRTAKTFRLANRAVGGVNTNSPDYLLQVSLDGQTVSWTNGTHVGLRRANGPSFGPADASYGQQLSGDGRYLVYWKASNHTIWRFDTTTAASLQVSLTPLGGLASGWDGSISYDGSRIAYRQPAGGYAVFDAATGGITVPPVPSGAITEPTISGDGRFVSYNRDAGGTRTVRRYDLASGTDIEVSVLAEPATPTGGRPPWTPEISGDGLTTVVTSDSTLAGEATTVATRRWAVAAGSLPAETVPQWVIGAYQDVLGRAPTSAERLAVEDDLFRLERTAPMVLRDLLHTPSFANPRAPMIRLYQAFFLRSPDSSGFTYWVGKRLAGQTLNRIASQFAGSSEFRTRYGTLTNRQFVDLVYSNVLGRPGDPGGVASWTGKLDNGTKTRGEVMVGFSESSEYVRQMANQVDLVLGTEVATGGVPTPLVLGEAKAQWVAGTSVTSQLRDLFEID